MVKLFSLKSPDEWATTKQACRDTYVVTCFLPSTIRILYVLTCNIAFQGNNFTGGRLDHQRPNGLQKSQFFVIAK